jgi:gamma-glutamyltranspeptidase
MLLMRWSQQISISRSYPQAGNIGGGGFMVYEKPTEKLVHSIIEKRLR